MISNQTIDPLYVRHMYVRPGWSLERVNATENHADSDSRVQYAKPLHRSPKIKPVVTGNIERSWNRHKILVAKRFRSFREARQPTSITFVDQRQRKYFKAATDENTYVDTTTFETMLMLCGHALNCNHTRPEIEEGGNESMGSSLIAAAAKTLTERAEGREAAVEYTKCLLHLDTHGASLHVK